MKFSSLSQLILSSDSKKQKIPHKKGSDDLKIKGNTSTQAMDCAHLHAYARAFVGLDEQKIQQLHALREAIDPHLPEITRQFYTHLQGIDKASPYLAGRLDHLQHTHQAWIKELFSSFFDVAYTEKMYRVGDIHAKIRLPTEFMVGAMSVLQGLIIRQVLQLRSQQTETLPDTLEAINAAMGFSLLIMQESYQASALTKELEKFLAITGMSRKLFDNLARAYRD